MVAFLFGILNGFMWCFVYPDGITDYRWWILIFLTGIIFSVFKVIVWDRRSK
jgi:hypothetical protein